MKIDGATGWIAGELGNLTDLVLSQDSLLWIPQKPLNLPSDTSMVDVRLSLTVTGLYTLVGMGIVLAFM
jgi:hypothetical protein